MRQNTFLKNQPDIGSCDDRGISRGGFGQGWVFKSWKNWYAADNQIPVYVPELSDTVYTRDKITSICKGQEDVAEIMFLALDWQHPETLLEDWFYNDELTECPSCGKLLETFLTDGITRQKICPYCGKQINEVK